MTIPVIGFFNNKGGVGKTSLVYHVSWMCADLNLKVLAVDLDPQANLTAAFLQEERLEELWPDGNHRSTIFGFVQPLLKGTGDITKPHVERIQSGLGLLVGDLALAGFEDQLSEVWPKAMDRDERAFRVTSAFWRIMQWAGKSRQADLILMDLGPNLGAINRAALIAADYVVVPLMPDLFSLQGLRNLGPRLRSWRQEWEERLKKNPTDELQLPRGDTKPLGYIVLQHSVRLDRPVKAYERWIAEIPGTYRESVLAKPKIPNSSIETDKECLALIKHYRSLMPLAQEARKPIFHLTPADGAIGAQVQAVQRARDDFELLAKSILDRSRIPVDIAL